MVVEKVRLEGVVTEDGVCVEEAWRDVLFMEVVGKNVGLVGDD